MFKRKCTEKPKLPKEYVWELDINGEDKIYKCVVTETMVTTYEGDVEKKHLKVMNPECKEGVLQIDTITSLYGEQVPFQLERFIPYIKLEGQWVSSDTTKQDRLDATVATYKNNSKMQIIVGVLCLIATAVKTWITGEMGDWFMLNVFGIFFIAAAATTMVRLKQELNAIEEAKAEAAEEQAVYGIGRKPEVLEAPASEKIPSAEPVEKE